MNILFSSVEQALFSLRSNKVRTFLSLLGMTIGIFSIVCVLSVVDSLKYSLNQGFESFGSDMVFIRQFPMGETFNRNNWRDYLRRSPISIDDFDFLKKNCNSLETISFAANVQIPVKTHSSGIKDAFAVGMSGDWKHLAGGEIETGRGFTEAETCYGQSGHNTDKKVAIIGASVCDRLFPGIDKSIIPGKTISVGNIRLTVIGVFAENGENMVKIFDTDNCVFMPVETLQSIIPLKNTSTLLAAVPAKNISKEEFKGEVASVMRTGRKLHPLQQDDFSIGELSFVAAEVDKIVAKINMAGVLIGGFSLLVGAFGIANIMFVSVKERTRQIGIYKALGAKRKTILCQFLSEAAILAVIGGAIGITLVYLLSFAFPEGGYFVLRVSVFRAFTGVLIAAVTGLVAGLAPALSASRMDPVKAINTI